MEGEEEEEEEGEKSVHNVPQWNNYLTHCMPQRMQKQFEHSGRSPYGSTVA